MESPQGPERVLVCDDDPGTRLLVCTILEKYGYRVVGEAENGLQSLNLYVEREPDIVVLDIKMPLGDGLAVLRYIRALDRKSRVVMLTVDDSPDAVKAALRLGADDYVIKTSLNTPRFLEALGRPAAKAGAFDTTQGDAAAMSGENGSEPATPAEASGASGETDHQNGEKNASDKTPVKTARRMVKPERENHRRGKSQ